MLHLVNETSEELIKVPEGENSIGRGALLKVGLEESPAHCGGFGVPRDYSLGAGIWE